MWIFLALTTFIVVELLLLISVGARIGVLGALFLVVITGVVGVVLVRGEGLGLIGRVREAELMGRLPAIEVIDAVLLIAAAGLLVWPGFLTDALGFLFVWPLSRPLCRKIVVALLLKRRMRQREAGRPADRMRRGGRGGYHSGQDGVGPIIDVTPEPDDDTPDDEDEERR